MHIATYICIHMYICVHTYICIHIYLRNINSTHKKESLNHDKC